MCKYTLFYKSPKNWGYYAYAQTVCTRPLLRGERPGDEANNNSITHSQSETQTMSCTCMELLPAV